jgi:predicted nucleic acid-binding protein
MRYVIDASVALRWYLEEEKNENADLVFRRLIDEPELFAIPELFAFETFAVLFRVHPNPAETFQQGILPLLSCGVLRYPMTEAIATRASRHVPSGLSGYDAVYVALAEELGALWLTFDERAHARLQGEGISVDLGQGLPSGW